MSLMTALAYWLIVGVWLSVLCTVAVFYRRDPRGLGTTRILLAVVAIEAFCNIVETACVDGQPAPFAGELAGTSGGAIVAMLPKLLNILAGMLVLAILLLRWLPTAVRERRAAEAQRELAIGDPLTGLANRRYFLIQAEIECDRARRYDRPLSLLVFDIDRFDGIEERRGNDFADRLLIQVAETCRTSTRNADIVARIARARFGIVLPETRAQNARRFAERLRQAMARLQPEGEETAITVSVGVVEANWESDFPKLVKRVDDALGEAKQAGGDCVHVFDASDAWIKQPA